MTTNMTTTVSPDPDDKGCPLDYGWCYNVPRVQLWQYIMASVIITIGFYCWKCHLLFNFFEKTW